MQVTCVEPRGRRISLRVVCALGRTDLSKKMRRADDDRKDDGDDGGDLAC